MGRPFKGLGRTAGTGALLFAALGIAVACAGSGSTGGQGPATRTATDARRPGGPPPSYDSITIQVLRRTRDGKQSEVLKLDKLLSELRSVPLSFVTRQVSGGQDAPSVYEPRLEIGAEKSTLPKQTWSCDKPASCLEKEWLRFELRGPGAPRVVERVLYERDEGSAEPVPGYRRYTTTLLTDAVSRAEVSRLVAERAPALASDARKQKVEALAEKGSPAALGELDALDAGGTLAHLLSLAFAAESDAATERLASAMGVKVGRETPRILVTSFESEGTEGNGTLSLDLRLDEVRAETDDPARARLFQLARGIEESTLEAKLVEKLAGEGTGVSTARLMVEARKQGIELRRITPATRARIGELGAPPRFAALLSRALGEGDDVVVPKSAVDLAGRSRWGFWRIHPETGVTIGVMEGGQHQGMQDYMRTTREVALDPQRAFVIGMHAGFIQGQFGFAALMLKYGEIGPELVEELKALLKDQACTACPPVSVGAEASLKFGEDCLKKELFKAKSEMEFCDSYNNGFKCAVGILMAALGGTNPWAPKLEAEVKLQLGCTEYKL